MQNRKSISAAFLLLLALTLFFTTLPLYAVNENTSNGNTNAPAAGQGLVEDGVLEEAADGARDMVGDNAGGDLVEDNQAETTIPGQTTTPGITEPGTVPDNTVPDTTEPSVTAGDGHTLGDTNGDGITEDSVVEDGVSWGWILLGLLAAAVVIVIIALCVSRRG